MRKKEIARAAGISPQFFSDLLAGRSLTRWPIAEKLGALTLSDPADWASGNTTAMAESFSRIKFISVAAKTVHIKSGKLIAFLAANRQHHLSDDEIIRLAVVTGTTVEQWRDKDLSGLHDAVDKFRHQIETDAAYQITHQN